MLLRIIAGAVICVAVFAQASFAADPRIEEDIVQMYQQSEQIDDYASTISQENADLREKLKKQGFTTQDQAVSMAELTQSLRDAINPQAKQHGTVTGKRIKVKRGEFMQHFPRSSRTRSSPAPTPASGSARPSP